MGGSVRVTGSQYSAEISGSSVQKRVSFSNSYQAPVPEVYISSTLTTSNRHKTPVTLHPQTWVISPPYR